MCDMLNAALVEAAFKIEHLDGPRIVIWRCYALCGPCSGIVSRKFS